MNARIKMAGAVRFQTARGSFQGGKGMAGLLSCPSKRSGTIKIMIGYPTYPVQERVLRCFVARMLKLKK